MNATGVAQAEKAGEILRKAGIAAIVSSPFARARRTAEIVAACLGLAAPISIEPELREASFGEREGQPMDAWFEAWIKGEATPKGAESFASVRARATRALARVLSHPGPVLVVAHGSVFRALRAEMGLSPFERAPNGLPMFCSAPPPAWSVHPAA